MKHSSEHIGQGYDLDSDKSPEGVNDYVNKPKSFEEHMQEIQGTKNSIDSPPVDNETKDFSREQAVAEAREKVLEVFGNKTENTEGVAGEDEIESKKDTTDESLHKLSLNKSYGIFYDENRKPFKRLLRLTGTGREGSPEYSFFNRYPDQMAEIQKEMNESFEKGKPLKVLNIGVSQGQEPLGYVQMAADLAGEGQVENALDLDVVEFAVKIPIIDNSLPNSIKKSSRDYLEGLYNSPKAHFGTPFQKYVKELKDRGEKRDVVLFNNVIQHLDYGVGVDVMLEDMKNLADIVEDNGILCMACNQRKVEKVGNLLNRSEEMLYERGFEKEGDDIFRKTNKREKMSLSKNSETF